MNGVEKWTVDRSNTPESQYPTLSIRERSETQLYAVRVSEPSRFPKRWVSLDLWWVWRIWRTLCFSLILGFRWHPFNPTLRCQGLGTFKVSKALGFTRSLVGVAYLENIVFFSDFRVSVASVQPNLQD
ncbi:MAG: hypothetical protein OXI63_03625 [Candidatus Poribacteria bacterium]|nr:hypothetical protein [Candidatus Poribacteria bacterium]